MMYTDSIKYQQFYIAVFLSFEMIFFLLNMIKRVEQLKDDIYALNNGILISNLRLVKLYKIADFQYNV